MINNAMAESITGRAIKAGHITVNAVNIRDFAGNKHNSVDDYPYGGGAGMVMQAAPVYRCYKAIEEEISNGSVSFRFDGGSENAISGLSFKAEPGKTTAIIGSTGCGKSTVVNLLDRFYDVTEGSITLDGVDIRDMSQKELRSHIGLVPQKGVLFSGTIESNIKYGGDFVTDEDMKEAAAIAQATEFIDSKKDGYAESIAQGGTNVSGGQKQRLSIARAVARNAKIYIFDDSFSALDFKTDVAVRKALREDMTDSTVFIVAQRVSTILHADQILVLDEGKIVGKGTHKELMENCPVYEQIARSQLSEKEIAASIA